MVRSGLAKQPTSVVTIETVHEIKLKEIKHQYYKLIVHCTGHSKRLELHQLGRSVLL